MSRIVVVLPRFPYPLDKGDKLRAFHQIRELARRSEVILFALSDEPVSPDAMAALAPHCRRIEVIRFAPARAWARALLSGIAGLPSQVAYFTPAGAAARLHALVEETRPDHVFCQTVRTAELARGLRVRRTLDYMDAFAWGLARRQPFERGLVRAVLRREEALMRRYEGEAFLRFDAHTVITAADRDRLDVPDAARVRVVGNGVDESAFGPRDLPRDYDLLFVGNLAYPPNVKAAEILVHEVLPRVRSRRPACRVLLAGTSPRRRVRRLAGPSVDVTGWVDDISRCYARARVFVAPLVMGTGLPNKLLQAMATGLPCVTTPAARMAVEAGDAQVRAADDPDGMAAEAVAILEDDALAARLGEAGRRLVAERFRWEQAVAPLAEILVPTAAPDAAAAAR